MFRKKPRFCRGFLLPKCRDFRMHIGSMSIVGVVRRQKIYLWCRGYAPVLFLRTAMQDTISESSKVSDTVASALQHLCLVIASFCIAVVPGTVHGVQDLLEPMMAGSCAIENSGMSIASTAAGGTAVTAFPQMQKGCSPRRDIFHDLLPVIVYTVCRGSTAGAGMRVPW